MFSQHPPDADLFRALFEAAPDAMIVVDRQGVIVLTNTHAERLFGYAAGGLVGLQVEALLPAPLQHAHIAHRAEYTAHPRERAMGASYELTGVRADGESFPVEIGLSPVVARQGTLYAASIRDISETKRARQALERARFDAAMAQISRRLLAATHHEKVIDGISGLVAATLEIPAAAIMLSQPYRAGLYARASTGLPLAVLEQLSEDPGLRDMANGKTLEAELPPPEQGACIEMLRRICPALGDDYQDAALESLPDRQGAMGLLLALAHRKDYFDRERLSFLQSVANILAASILRERSEEQLGHAQRLDAIGQLTGGIAHDFNNLLTVVSGNLQLLEMDLPGDKAIHETLASASRAVERGAALTRKLLTFSRRQHLLPRAVHTVQLLADLSEMLGRTLGERITVTTECSSEVPAVYADEGELEAALINLAINARDAMPRGGRLAISARACHVVPTGDDSRLAPGAYVLFTVADNGEGIAPHILEHVLEPFFTTKEVGKGSGLGLSMVYGFMKQSGGHLHIESQVGQGTRVELYLPAASAEAVEGAVPARSHGGRENVLVVEDEHEVRRVAVAFLRSLGYSPCEAADAATALQQLERRRDIHLLFTDIVLGGEMTGFELAAKARERNPQLPVLFTSGYEYASMGIDTRAFGAYELLRKPYRREQLGAAIRRVLDRDHGA
ncbi:PAS domain S-box protein [Rhodanobacter ginsengiterrae]|uniref:PAS domain S-box protein n=1 Tax=Rhodanobacter ginsengiterrae TaxID=2008451 RepID=UPI003CF71030